jgi:hypothetical protein
MSVVKKSEISRRLIITNLGFMRSIVSGNVSQNRRDSWKINSHCEYFGKVLNETVLNLT